MVCPERRPIPAGRGISVPDQRSYPVRAYLFLIVFVADIVGAAPSPWTRALRATASAGSACALRVRSRPTRCTTARSSASHETPCTRGAGAGGRSAHAGGGTADRSSALASEDRDSTTSRSPCTLTGGGAGCVSAHVQICAGGCRASGIRTAKPSTVATRRSLPMRTPTTRGDRCSRQTPAADDLIRIDAFPASTTLS